MAAHQCPKCVLRFAWLTELRWHLREEHPDFHVGDYPAPAQRAPERPATSPAKDRRP